MHLIEKIRVKTDLITYTASVFSIMCVLENEQEKEPRVFHEVNGFPQMIDGNVHVMVCKTDFFDLQWS